MKIRTAVVVAGLARGAGLGSLAPVCGSSTSTGGTSSSGGNSECPESQTTCDDKCVDLQSDPANCGACGTACAAGEASSSGACAVSCQAGLTECGGTCGG